jgi:hypothetical protein
MDGSFQVVAKAWLLTSNPSCVDVYSVQTIMHSSTFRFAQLLSHLWL